MIKTKIRFVDIICWLSIISADIIVYLFLGILQMDYDDSYDSSKGVYWSLVSMNKWQLFYYCLLHLWNILNLIALIFLGRKMYRHKKATYK